jgi:hypothetical protein
MRSDASDSADPLQLGLQARLIEWLRYETVGTGGDPSADDCWVCFGSAEYDLGPVAA